MIQRLQWSGGIVILCIAFLMQSALAFAKTTTYIGTPECTWKQEDVLEVPVCIQGNTGMMGYYLSLEYEDSFLEIEKISAGELTEKGIFDSNPGKKKGKVDILWSNTSEVKQDGTIAVLYIRKKKKFSRTKIKVNYQKNDTFNEKYEDLIWECSDLVISCKSEKVSVDAPQYPDSEKNEKNHAVPEATKEGEKQSLQKITKEPKKDTGGKKENLNSETGKNIFEQKEQDAIESGKTENIKQSSEENKKSGTEYIGEEQQQGEVSITEQNTQNSGRNTSGNQNVTREKEEQKSSEVQEKSTIDVDEAVKKARKKQMEKKSKTQVQTNEAKRCYAIAGIVFGIGVIGCGIFLKEKHKRQRKM